MSSTETLTFGPEWLRNLSGGSASASSPGSTTSISTVKFKLAQYRYGREEMLALFEKQDEIHPELAEAPNLISKEALMPMSLIPLTEEDQRAFSGGVNSETYRGRGGSGSFRGRSAPPRGRGRGRGDGYSRSMSQTDDGSGPPYSRGSSREYSRRDNWDDRSFGRGRSFDDAPSRKPLRRSDVSADWRSDANQASGDGTDVEDSRPEWRPAAASRRDSWRDGGRSSGGNWRDGGSREWSEVSSRRPLNRTRSLSSKYDHGDSGLMPEWADDTDNMEVGMFNSSGAFETKKSGSLGKGDLNNKSNHRPTAQLPLKRIEERDKSVGEEEAAQAKLDREEEHATKILEQEQNPPISNEEDVFEESEIVSESNKEESKVEPEPPSKESPFVPPPVAPPASEALALTPEPKIEISESKRAKPLAADLPPPATTTVVEEEPQMHHLEEAALKLVDSISEADDHLAWSTSLPVGDPLSNVNPAIPDLATKWFYKDPQGETQGPFGAQEMKEWFIAGYFTQNLLVKRACDPQFIALGQLIDRWGEMPFDKKHGLSPQPSSSDLQRLALQQQQQKQFQLQQQQQQQQLLQQQQQLLQQQQVMRALQQQQQQQQVLLLQQLNKSEEFQALPIAQQQTVLAQYLQQLQQQQQTQLPTVTAPLNIASTPSSLHGLWEADPSIARRHSPVPMATAAQQHQLIELIKQKAKEQDILAKKKQEEQEAQKRIEEEMRRREDEQRRREEEQRRREQEEQLRIEEEKRRRQQEELQRKHEEALRIQAEEAKRKEEEARRIQAERLREKMLQEQERIKRDEERKEELRRLEEERQEEARRRREEEEERRRKEALKRLAEEEEKKRMEESIKRKLEEEKEKQRKQKEKERLQQQKLEEERKIQEKKAQEDAAKKLELQRQKEETLRKRQQEQLKDIKLPASANWAHQQPSSVLNTLSVASIQKQEAAEERKKEQEQLRLMKQQQKVQGTSQAKGVWGSGGVSGMSAPTPAPSNRPLSLMEIQMEEEKRQMQQKQTQPKPDLSFPTALAWSGRQPQPASAPAAWGLSAPLQQPTTVGLWEYAKPKEKSSSESKQQAKQTSRGKQKSSGSTSAESSNVASLFRQSSQSTDPFAAWCEDQLRRLQAAKNIDISTFVAFLRDIESPYDVKDYVTSYLGETPATRDFAESFIQRRNSYLKQQRQQKAKKSEPAPRKPVQPQQPVAASWNAIAAQPEVVTGNTKRGKKKQRKLQKVDPSILGFSVNAASDRFNMGEIEVPEDT